jgi:hypothetical protein
MKEELYKWMLRSFHLFLHDGIWLNAPEGYNPIIGNDTASTYDLNNFHYGTGYIKANIDDLIEELSVRSDQTKFRTWERIDNNSVYIGFITQDSFIRFYVKDIKKVYTLLYRKFYKNVEDLYECLERDRTIVEFNEEEFNTLVTESYDNICEAIQEVNKQRRFLLSDYTQVRMIQ